MTFAELHGVLNLVTSQDPDIQYVADVLRAVLLRIERLEARTALPEEPLILRRGNP